MTWKYQQSTGELSHDGELVATGYAGHGEGKNNPEMQAVHDVGPLPVGQYWIQAPQDTATHGPYVLRLEPGAGNEMYGRAGMLMHGDSKSDPGNASHGCIIMPRTVRTQVWESGDRALEVVA